MSLDRLKIVSVDQKSSSDKGIRPKTNREEVRARFETQWLRFPEQFNAFNNSMDQLRLERTLQLIDEICPVADQKVIDLGCGRGSLSRELRNKKAKLSALDVATNALDLFRKEGSENILLLHDCMPYTMLDDGIYDIVVCTDLIAHLKPQEHRIFFSELARIVKRDGYIVCSTPIDIYSEDALSKFSSLAETELEILCWKFSYHSFYIKLLNFLQAPSKFARASKDLDYRKKSLAKRYHIGRWWWKLNSVPILGSFWNYFSYFSNPIFRWINKNKSILLNLEKACRFLKSDIGISHAIFVAKRRSLISHEDSVIAVEKQIKKPIWE